MEFTHYSLFEENKETGRTTAVADFATIENGLPALIEEIRQRAGVTGRNCMGVGGNSRFFDCAHPDGSQLSLTFAGRLHLILFTKSGLQAQASELSAEGNDSAALANKAING